MPLASMSSGALALLSAATAAAGGAAGAGIEALTKGSDRKAEKELATINQIEPGFENFGEELIEERDFGLRNANRPVLFPLGSNPANRNRR